MFLTPFAIIKVQQKLYKIAKGIFYENQKNYINTYSGINAAHRLRKQRNALRNGLQAANIAFMEQLPKMRIFTAMP